MTLDLRQHTHTGTITSPAHTHGRVHQPKCHASSGPMPVIDSGKLINDRFVFPVLSQKKKQQIKWMQLQFVRSLFHVVAGQCSWQVMTQMAATRTHRVSRKTETKIRRNNNNVHEEVNDCQRQCVANSVKDDDEKLSQLLHGSSQSALQDNSSD